MEPGQIWSSFLPALGHFPVLRAIIGVVIVFFVPGLAWTFVFFDRISIIERVCLAVGISIAFVTLGIIVLNVLFHVRINGVDAVLTIIAITVAGAAGYLLKRFLRQPADAGDE